MQDIGTISNKNMLPITAFSYGPLEYELEKAKVTFGPLKCKGLISASDDFLEPIGPPGPRGVPGLSGPPGLQGSPAPVEPKVVFGAVRKGPSVASGTVVTFTDLIINEGDGMDIESGTFKAPVSGVFYLTFSGLSLNEDDDTYIQVRKNGNFQFEIDESDNGEGNEKRWHNISYNWMMKLTKGDTVQLKVTNNGLWSSANEDFVFFTGQLVSTQ